MTDFAAKAPTHPDRVHELHDQDAMPNPPARTRFDWVALASIVVLGAILAVVFTAMGIQIRAGWESHRDWVVPAFAQVAAIGGVAAAYLLVRGYMSSAGVGFTFMAVALVIIGANYLRGIDTEGSDALRNWFSVISGILWGAGLVAFTAAAIAHILNDPEKAPQPEM